MDQNGDKNGNHSAPTACCPNTSYPWLVAWSLGEISLNLADHFLNNTLCDSRQDLVGYKKFKDKEVSSAARGLAGLFREIAPAMLAKKDRGRGADLEAAPLQYGANVVADRIMGAELLQADLLRSGQGSDAEDGDQDDSNEEAALDEELGLELQLGSDDELGSDAELESDAELKSDEEAASGKDVAEDAANLLAAAAAAESGLGGGVPLSSEEGSDDEEEASNDEGGSGSEGDEPAAAQDEADGEGVSGRGAASSSDSQVQVDGGPSASSDDEAEAEAGSDEDLEQVCPCSTRNAWSSNCLLIHTTGVSLLSGSPL